MLFADDLVICENTHKQAEEQLELWRKAIENKGTASQQEQGRISTTAFLYMTVKFNLVEKR